MPDGDNPTGQNPTGGVAGTEGNEQTVPLKTVESLRDEIRDLKGTVDLQADQIRLYRANQLNQPDRRTDETNLGGNLFEDVEDTDPITLGDLKKVMAGQEKVFKSVLTELEVKSSNPDFVPVVNKYIPILAKSRPDLAQAIRNSSNPALLAYEYCKTLPEFKKDEADSKLTGSKSDGELSEDAKKLLENQGKPGAASSAGGGAGGTNSADYYAGLSEEDIEAKIAEARSRG